MTRDKLIELLKLNFKEDEEIIFTEDYLDDDDCYMTVNGVRHGNDGVHSIHLETLVIGEEEDEEDEEEEEEDELEYDEIFDENDEG